MLPGADRDESLADQRSADREPEPQGEADPETAVGGERGGTEYVSVAELPHAGQQLGESAVGESVAEPCVAGGMGHPAGILGRQQERSEGKGCETQGSRVGDS